MFVRMGNSISLEFLGTGTSQGVPVVGCGCNVCRSSDARDKRLRTSALIKMNGVQMVIDTGPDFRQQLLRAEIDRLDAVLYTHEHTDHIIGLDDIRAINFKHGVDMPLYATESVENNIRRIFNYAFTEVKYPGVPIVHFNRIGDAPFVVGGQQVIPIRALHGDMEVLGFRFGDLTYLTDVKTIAPAELEKVKGSSVVVLNALRISEHHSHLNLQQAVELITAIGPERGYFTHISHLLGKHADVAHDLPAGMHLAYDGLSITV
jgi:phosphoribosyl 1,2-cyclic phosphate phosphodiesterase